MLKFAKLDLFSFCWSKEGCKRQINTTAEPNVLTFQSISEKDYGYYRCEVKEADKVVLTVYKALYKDEFTTTCMEHSQSGIKCVIGSEMEDHFATKFVFEFVYSATREGCQILVFTHFGP